MRVETPSIHQTELFMSNPKVVVVTGVSSGIDVLRPRHGTVRAAAARRSERVIE
jgi:hypothetical protein